MKSLKVLFVFTLISANVFLFALSCVQATTTFGDDTNLDNNTALNYMRVQFPSLTATEVTVTSSVAGASGLLNDDSRYSVVCTQDTFVDYGATVVTADKSDEDLLTAKVKEWFATGGVDDIRHASFINSTDAGNCYLKEWK